MNDLHYRFPPASAYRLNRCLFALKSDREFLARYLADPNTAIAEMELAEDEARELLLRADRPGRSPAGSNAPP